MKLLTIVFWTVVAGCGAYQLLRRRNSYDAYLQETAGAPEAREDSAADNCAAEEPSDGEADAAVPALQCGAMVVACCRAMDPLSIIGASRVTFCLEDGTEKKLLIRGENGLNLRCGDRGVLEYQADDFICFEKENGEVVGALYYVPAPSEEENT